MSRIESTLCLVSARKQNRTFRVITYERFSLPLLAFDSVHGKGGETETTTKAITKCVVPFGACTRIRLVCLGGS